MLRPVVIMFRNLMTGSVRNPELGAETEMEIDMAATSKKRREWTKQDVRELKGAARQKTPAPKIARSLRRTLGAIRQKAFSMGVSLDSRT
jgi:hypothetical protein